MLTWITIAILYVLGMGLFRWIGGLPAAADALSSWGRATAERRRHAVSPTS
jgi:hypothetical protein